MDKIIELSKTAGHWKYDDGIIKISFEKLISKILPELREEEKDWKGKYGITEMKGLTIHSKLTGYPEFLDYLKEKYCSKKKLK